MNIKSTHKSSILHNSHTMTALDETLFESSLGNNISLMNSNTSNASNSVRDIVDIIQIPLFSLIIIIASIYITLVLSRKTLRKNQFNWLTLNVCFASVIFALIQLLSTIIRLNDISETIISCRLKGFIINMATCYIMYSHCTTTFCRLLSVQYPHKPLFRSSRWLIGNIIISGMLGPLIASPYLFFDGFSCSRSNYGKRFLQIYAAVSTILIPILVFTGCNFAIYRYVRQSSKRVHDSTKPNVNQLNNRDMYLCKIILLTFCVFVIGWMPLFLEQIFLVERTRLPSSVAAFFQILSPTCLLADVLILIYSDHSIRNLLIKAFQCHGRLFKS